MILVLGKVLSIFLLIAVGFFVGRMNILPQDSLNVLNVVLLKVVAPCLIISSITSKELTEDTLTVTIQILSITAIFCLTASILGLFLSKFVFKIHLPENIGVYAFAFASLNCGFLGFPVTLALFGHDIFYLMVMENVVTIIYFYVCGPILLKIDYVAGAPIHKVRLSWREIIGNPNIIASFLSLSMLFGGIHLPSILFDSVETLGSATIPLSMLVVGLQLSASKLIDIIKNYKLVAFAATKMLILPILTFLSINWLPIAVPVKVCAIMASVFPVAVVVAPITAMEGKDSMTAAKLIAITTLMSVATIPLFATLLTEFYLS